MNVSALFEYLLIIFGVLVLLLVRFLIGREFLAAAQDKGYTSDKYLWWIMFIGIAGMLLVIALPDRGADTMTNTGTSTAPVVPTMALPAGAARGNKSRVKPSHVSAGLHSSRSGHLEAEDMDSLPRL